MNETYQILDKARWEGAKVYEESVLAPYVAEQNMINSQINALESKIQTSEPVERVSLIQQVGALRVRLSEVEQVKLEKHAEAITYVLRNLNSFADQQLSKNFEESYAEKTRLEGQLILLERQTSQERGRAYTLWTQKRNQRVERLGLIDFVYFSLGVATTTTFGDILPNSATIRLVVIAQLTLCLIVVGVFVTAVAQEALGP
jgi:hypothetical protein